MSPTVECWLRLFGDNTYKLPVQSDTAIFITGDVCSVLAIHLDVCDCYCETNIPRLLLRSSVIGLNHTNGRVFNLNPLFRVRVRTA